MNFKDRAYAVFVAGVVATVFHAIDDAFLQPQPGTSPLDHLSIGLVALAVGGVSLWAYRRVRPGTRALLGLTWSLIALVSGVEALYYGQHGGMSGDDYSGLVALATAPLLAGAAVMTLWKSRRLNDRIWRRYTRRSLKAVLWVALAALWVTPFVIAYIGGHVSRSSVPPAAALGASHEDVTLRTSDGLKLEGWYVPSRNGAAVILFPGRKGPLTRARMLARRGFGVLLFDRRGEGRSEGDPDSWGWDFNKDIGAGIDFLKTPLRRRPAPHCRHRSICRRRDDAADRQRANGPGRGRRRGRGRANGQRGSRRRGRPRQDPDRAELRRA
jgi:hypothetical protein